MRIACFSGRLRIIPHVERPACAGRQRAEDLVDAGGDLDAAWEDVNDSGSETVAGDNPTPDQSLVEENAQAMGVSYEDNEELEFIDKIEKRDRERYELDENSKASEDMI